MKASRRLVLSIGWLAIGAQGCATTESEDTAETLQASTALGDPLPGTDLTAFTAARDNFAQDEDINDGLGPTFNEKACGNCHNLPVIGGSGANIERRFGRVTDGVFFGYDRDPDNEGGTLRQLFSNGTYQNGDVSCTIPLDAEAADANIHNVGRRTTPLFGLGLVDAMPDAWFDFIAQTEPSSVRGTINRVAPPIPDSRDPSQAIGKLRVSRFGLKAQEPGLVSFSADAYDNEMGITTQSCYKGSSMLAFANENYPNNVAPPSGCNGGDLAPANPDGDPQVPVYTDDAVGDCDGGRDELQGDVHNFTFFMEHLAPPPRNITNPINFARGAAQFANAGCAGCHSAVPFVTPQHPFNGVPGNHVFFPFSDFLVHDMGFTRRWNRGDRRQRRHHAADANRAAVGRSLQHADASRRTRAQRRRGDHGARRTGCGCSQRVRSDVSREPEPARRIRQRAVNITAGRRDATRAPGRG